MNYFKFVLQLSIVHLSFAQLPPPDIPSNFDISEFIHEPTGTPNLPADTSHEPSGAFRTLCKFSHLAYDDPIVYPNEYGKSHLHYFFGNTMTDASSTFESLRTTGNSTCNGNKVNRSSYWFPTVINGNNKVVDIDAIVVYYKSTGPPVNTSALPNGLRLIAGYNFETKNQSPRTTHGYMSWSWSCHDDDNATWPEDVLKDAAGYRSLPTKCSGRIAGRISFPNCWNGQIDSPDHRSHVVYAYFGAPDYKVACPDTHPIRMPSITYNLMFRDVDGDVDTWRLSSDTPDIPRGASLHADYFEAWDPIVKDRWLKGCVRGMRSCSGGPLGDGASLDNSVYQILPTNQRLDVPTRPSGSSSPSTSTTAVTSPVTTVKTPATTVKTPVTTVKTSVTTVKSSPKQTTSSGAGVPTDTTTEVNPSAQSTATSEEATPVTLYTSLYDDGEKGGRCIDGECRESGVECRSNVCVRSAAEDCRGELFCSCFKGECLANQGQCVNLSPDGSSDLCVEVVTTPSVVNVAFKLSMSLVLSLITLVSMLA